MKILHILAYIQEKVSFLQVPLATLYPKYTGGTDGDKGVKFILRRFKQLNRARLPMYPQ
jgi:hypothetical protein